MLRNIVSLDQQIENWTSQWILANDTPLDVCDEFHLRYGQYLAAVRERSNEIKAQQEAEEKEKVESIAVTEEIEVIKIESDEIKTE